MKEVVHLVSGLGCFVCTLTLVIYFLRRHTQGNNMELEQALKTVLEAGCDVCKAGYRLYERKAGAGQAEYTMLHFDNKSNLIPPDEKRFITVADAVADFSKKVF